MAALALPLVWSLYRSNELFRVEISRGRVRLVSGRLPPRLLGDLADVAARARIAHARLRVVKEQGRPRLVVAAGSVAEGTLQQLRNVVGQWEVQKIRAGSRRA